MLNDKRKLVLTKKGSKPTGIVLIDKPTGVTSHDVVDRIRKLTGVKRVGHAGTLDPLASGLLIILVGRDYTKQQSRFLKQDKEYIATARLGITTDTYDIEGRVLEEKQWSQIRSITKEDIKKVLKRFKGEIKQTVPPFSAVKVMGRKLYDEARKGRIDKSKLPKRTVVIHNLVLTDFKRNEVQQTIYFSIKAKVSSGTYIRSLIHDIGQTMGVVAVVTGLSRTRIGNFLLSDAVKLSQLYSVQDIQQRLTHM